MKQLTIFSCCAVLASTLFLFSGCKKLLDYIGEHPGQGGSSYCAIKEFAYKGLFLNADTLRFAYNGAGNPVSVIRRVPRTGAPNFFFQYDKKNRLTDLVGSYGPTVHDVLEIWNIYFYDAAGRIVKDSVYFFPEIVDGHPTAGEFGSAWVILYEYDTKDRVSKTSAVFSPDFSQDETFSYDAAGNRTGDTYDNKVNFHQTNKIWMFLDRDYSVNNPVTKASYTYNSAGLPATVSVSDGALNFLTIPGEGEGYVNAGIKYDCSY